jgi:hypothetical protein
MKWKEYGTYPLCPDLRNSLGGTEKLQKISDQIVGVPTEIRSGKLPNKRQKYYTEDRENMERISERVNVPDMKINNLLRKPLEELQGPGRTTQRSTLEIVGSGIDDFKFSISFTRAFVAYTETTEIGPMYRFFHDSFVLLHFPLEFSSILLTRILI